ncbi:MAG: hypothetical protein ABIG20_00600 [archaeon]
MQLSTDYAGAVGVIKDAIRAAPFKHKRAFVKEFNFFLNINWFKQINFSKEKPGVDLEIEKSLALFGVDYPNRYRLLDSLEKWGLIISDFEKMNSDWRDIREHKMEAAAREFLKERINPPVRALVGNILQFLERIFWNMAPKNVNKELLGSVWSLAKEDLRGDLYYIILGKPNPFKPFVNLWKMGFLVSGVIDGEFTVSYVPTPKIKKE